MIFPFLKGFIGFSKAPLTWSLFLANAIILMAGYGAMTHYEKEWNELLKNDYYLKTQGGFFAQFVKDNPDFYDSSVQEMAQGVLSGEQDKRQFMAALAIRDPHFLKAAGNYQFSGDQVALKWWQGQFKKMKNIQKYHPHFFLGLNSDHVSFWNWISYQFVHGGFMHFAFNMLPFLIFGASLEMLFGSFLLLITYVGSGIFAAGAFLLLTEASAAPLVGASGAVSGVIAFVCMIYGTRPVRYIYWLFLPLRGYVGFVYLPAWLAFVFWFFSDFAGYLSSLDLVGGIAYTAHLGGHLAGVITAGIIYGLKSLKKEPVLKGDQDPVPPLLMKQPF